MRNIFLACIFLMLCASAVKAQTTTVYIVRHAEKDLTDADQKNPPLSPAGIERSYALDKLLSKEKVDMIFSTNFKRTLQTAAPLSKRIGKEPIVYNDVKEVAEKVRNEYKGKTILIVGHSNSSLQIVKALGGTSNVTEIKDSEYYNLFKLKIRGDQVKSEDLKYGVQ